MKQYKINWKAYIKTITPTFGDYFDYCIVKALNSNIENKYELAVSLLRRSFTPVTNESLLVNGRTPWDTLKLHLIYFNNKSDSQFVKDSCDVEQYHSLAHKLNANFNDIDKSDPYVYIFVRQDLSPEQQLVQAGHAVYVLGSKHKDHSQAHNTSFVVIGVPNMSELYDICGKLDRFGIAHEHFIEPDLQGELTALATYPLTSYTQRRKLRKYKLLSMSNGNNS